ncbi:unnamed protein product, partial [Prorocentrum cordatum]
MCGQAPKKPSVSQPPPPRGSWTRPPRLPQHACGPQCPSDAEIAICAATSAAGFGAISDGWLPRAVGRARAARAVPQGEPRACARQARIQQDTRQQKLEQAKSEVESARVALAQATQAAASAQAEPAVAQAAADDAATKAAQAFGSLAPAAPKDGDLAFHGWAKGLREQAVPDDPGAREKFLRILQQLDDIAKELGGVERAVPSTWSSTTSSATTCFMAELDEKHGIKQGLASSLFHDAKERIAKKAKAGTLPRTPAQDVVDRCNPSKCAVASPIGSGNVFWIRLAEIESARHSEVLSFGRLLKRERLCIAWPPGPWLLGGGHLQGRVFWGGGLLDPFSSLAPEGSGWSRAQVRVADFSLVKVRGHAARASANSDQVALCHKVGNDLADQRAEQPLATLRSLLSAVLEHARVGIAGGRLHIVHPFKLGDTGQRRVACTVCGAICYNAGVSACEKVSYNAGISACEKGGQWQRALTLLSEMREVNELWNKALDLLGSMLRARVDPAAADSPDEGLYVHDIEAGGPKDVLKHIVLVALLQQIVAGADPFTFIDMHAASGVYDLGSEESLRCRMFEKGVLRLSHAADRCGKGLVADYLAAVWRCNQALGSSSRALGFYPGSPALAWQWLRPQDTAVLFEAAAEPYEALRRSFSLLCRGLDRRLELLHDDSYLRVIFGPWPWPSGRQLVLLDPPYDSIQSHNTWNVFVLRRLLQRSPSSCVALWYPLVDPEKIAGLHSQVQSLRVGSVLVAEMWVGGSWPRGDALQGSGVLVVNPPLAVHAQLLAELPGLQGALQAT